MARYEVTHKVTQEFYFGEYEAKDKEDAYNQAISDLPMTRDDYKENDDEFIIEELPHQ